jgi:hypothetical protein
MCESCGGENDAIFNSFAIMRLFVSIISAVEQIFPVQRPRKNGFGGENRLLIAIPPFIFINQTMVN